jgi:hypothetical protein
MDIYIYGIMDRERYIYMSFFDVISNAFLCKIFELISGFSITSNLLTNGNIS